jgi:hypothetical protein
MIISANKPVELHFVLDVVDEWPPVALEGIPCVQTSEGFKINSPPLFVKGISRDDVITVTRDAHGNVLSWRHSLLSRRSTIWILRTGPGDNIAQVVAELEALNCISVQLPQLGCYAIDVPAEVQISDVDKCLAKLDAESAAVAYPSFRHDE